MRNLSLAILALFAVCCAAPAFAGVDAGDIDPDGLLPLTTDEVSVDDPTSIARLLLNAAGSKRWGLVVALSLVAGVWVARRYGAKLPIPKVAAFITSDRGGPVLTFAGSFGAALATGLMGGKPLGVDLVVSAVSVALMAMGAYAGGKKMVRGT